MASKPEHESQRFTLMTLDPGHFHAALLQKRRLDHVADEVYVFAPQGQDLTEHLAHIQGFNSRPDHPTDWRQRVYSGPDYLTAMLRQRPGNVVVIAGINRRKTAYIQTAVEAGLHVLADKPMCIDVDGWQRLNAIFDMAADRGVLVYDIMTSRHEITTILFRLLVNSREVFGTIQSGTPEAPAVTKESVHHLFKYVAGHALRRPAWYFDVNQQGDGIVDVTTHLVDLVMWECFPEQAIDHSRDVTILDARRWPTMITPEQFARVTGLSGFPADLRHQVNAHGHLPYSCNGEIRYSVKGVHVKVAVRWDFEAPEGGGDTHAAVTRGTRSTVQIRQGEPQHYRPEVYVEAADTADTVALGDAIRQVIEAERRRYPDLGLQRQGDAWHITIPDVYRLGHEAHFGLVAETFLHHLQAGSLPHWEMPNMLAKYYTTSRALQVARQ